MQASRTSSVQAEGERIDLSPSFLRARPILRQDSCWLAASCLVLRARSHSAFARLIPVHGNQAANELQQQDQLLVAVRRKQLIQFLLVRSV
jgi:hypothetical protein